MRRAPRRTSLTPPRASAQGLRATKKIKLKSTVDKALEEGCECVTSVLVHKRTGNPEIGWVEGRDEWMHEAMACERCARLPRPRATAARLPRAPAARRHARSFGHGAIRRTARRAPLLRPTSVSSRSSSRRCRAHRST